MTTKLIGIKEFRQNMAKISKQAMEKKYRLIILRKNVPIFELRPLSKNDLDLEKLLIDIEEAKKDIKKGRIYSQEDIMKEFE